MAERQTGRTSDQFNLRLPEGMRDHLRDEAEKNGRSMNAEIVARLSDSLGLEHAGNPWTDVVSDYNKISARLAVILPLILHLSKDEVEDLIARQSIMEQYHKASRTGEGKKKAD